MTAEVQMNRWSVFGVASHAARNALLLIRLRFAIHTPPACLSVLPQSPCVSATRAHRPRLIRGSTVPVVDDFHAITPPMRSLARDSAY